MRQRRFSLGPRKFLLGRYQVTGPCPGVVLALLEARDSAGTPGFPLLLPLALTWLQWEHLWVLGELARGFQSWEPPAPCREAAEPSAAPQDGQEQRQDSAPDTHTRVEMCRTALTPSPSLLHAEEEYFHCFPGGKSCLR